MPLWNRVRVNTVVTCHSRTGWSKWHHVSPPGMIWPTWFICFKHVKIPHNQWFFVIMAARKVTRCTWNQSSEGTLDPCFIFGSTSVDCVPADSWLTGRNTECENLFSISLCQDFTNIPTFTSQPRVKSIDRQIFSRWLSVLMQHVWGCLEGVFPR